MGVCDMCGSETRLYKAKIEETMLNVCENCARYGKVVENIPDRRYIQKKQKKREKELISKDEILSVVVDDFASIIKEKREKLGLKQEDFAKKIKEKVSIIHKMETGHHQPNLDLARKIEQFLKVKLIEQQTAGSADLEKTKSGSFTLGDFIKTRR